ncbi:hypothetical protein KC821_17285 [Proteus vulgaris]|uniref:hypothetical protein n=1 Tax=Proteus TaxID=583 RepID=UPI0020943C7B|nr:hypothetical protein [Proteus terrae]MCO7048578.1 hypothetical protein [Proteus terrae]
MIKFWAATAILLVSLLVINITIQNDKTQSITDENQFECIEHNHTKNNENQPYSHNKHLMPQFNIKAIQESCYERWSLKMARHY